MAMSDVLSENVQQRTQIMCHMPVAMYERTVNSWSESPDILAID
jgi:hypothetical protein